MTARDVAVAAQSRAGEGGAGGVALFIALFALVLAALSLLGPVALISVVALVAIVWLWRYPPRPGAARSTKGSARSGEADAGQRKLCLVFVDSLRTDKLEETVAAGKAPNFGALLARGELIPDCVSAFPSVTPVCTSEIATGATADRHWITRDELVPPGRAPLRRVRLVVRGDARVRPLPGHLRHRLQHEHGPPLARGGDLLRVAGRRRGAHRLHAVPDLPRPHPPRAGARRPAAARRRRRGLPPRGLRPGRVLLRRAVRQPARCPASRPSPGPGTRDEYSACVSKELVADDAYDFLLFSLPDNDYHSHRFGPDAMPASIAHADGCFGELVEACGGMDALPRLPRRDPDGRPRPDRRRAPLRDRRRAREGVARPPALVRHARDRRARRLAHRPRGPGLRARRRAPPRRLPRRRPRPPARHGRHRHRRLARARRRLARSSASTPARPAAGDERVEAVVETRAAASFASGPAAARTTAAAALARDRRPRRARARAARRRARPATTTPTPSAASGRRSTAPARRRRHRLARRGLGVRRLGRHLARGRRQPRLAARRRLARARCCSSGSTRAPRSCTTSGASATSPSWSAATSASATARR